MQKNTIFIISLVILIGMIGVYVIYTKSSPQAKVPVTAGPTSPGMKPIGSIPELKARKITIQEWQTEICKNLSANQCENNDTCVKTGPAGNCATTGYSTVCTSSIQFQNCGTSDFSSTEIEKIKMTCQNIGGEFWKYSTGNYYCECNDDVDDANDCGKKFSQQLKNN